jgi:EcsC protein family
MLEAMARFYKSVAARAVGRFMRFGAARGLRSVEIDPEEFRRTLAERHGLWVPHFGRMKDAPLEKLDAIAERLIRDSQRLAMAEGAGFGLGGVITIIPDTGFLTIITLRLIQRLCLLYGFEENGVERRLQMWLAAAAASGVDFSKDMAEKQMVEKIVPRLARSLAMRLGEESAEKWVGRLVPLASSAIGGALNYSFVRTWGRRVHRHLREKHLAQRSGGPTVASLRPVIVR